MLLFGFAAGVVADRVDRSQDHRRRSTSPAPSSSRVLAATIVTDAVNIALILVALFLLGTAETFADVGGRASCPRRPARGPGRRQRPALGRRPAHEPAHRAADRGAPVRLGMALPFAADAACFALGALLITRVVSPQPEPRRSADAHEPGARTWPRASAGSPHHPPMRTLAITIFAFNVTFGAAWAVLVLYAQERLGMDRRRLWPDHHRDGDRRDHRHVSMARLERRFSLGDIMRVGLLIETGTHLVLALTTRARRRPRDVRRVRRARVRVGHDRHRHPPARVPDELLGRVRACTTSA